MVRKNCFQAFYNPVYEKQPPCWVVIFVGAADGTSLLAIRHAVGVLCSQSRPLKTPTLRRFFRREARRPRLQVPSDSMATKNNRPVGWLFLLAKELTIDKMHRSNQIVKRCTAFAHPYFGVVHLLTISRLAPPSTSIIKKEPVKR